MHAVIAKHYYDEQCISDLATVVLAMKFALVILLALLSHLEEIQSVQPVYFSLIVSYGEFGFDSSGAIPSIDIALRYVNNRSQLLPEYELRYITVRNSKVGASSHCKLVSVFIIHGNLAFPDLVINFHEHFWLRHCLSCITDHVDIPKKFRFHVYPSDKINLFIYNKIAIILTMYMLPCHFISKPLYKKKNSLVSMVNL